jgi:curved DNA-binding protein
MSDTVDLYGILGLTIDATKSEIKKKYRELAKKYHPDKGGNENLYELITRSYNILSDSVQRETYDLKILEKKQEKESIDFVNMRNKFNSYMSNQTQDVVSKERAPEEFKRHFEDMNRKHGFNKEEQASKLDGTTMDRSVRELEFSRKQDDIELDGPLFSPDEFANDKFNAIFDTLDRKRRDIITYDEPLAWNMNSYECSKFDASTYEDIYAEDGFEGNSVFSHIDKNDTSIKLANIDLNNLQPAAYYDNHNNIDIDYDKLFKERMHERKQLDRALKKQ